MDGCLAKPVEHQVKVAVLVGQEGAVVSKRGFLCQFVGGGRRLRLKSEPTDPTACRPPHACWHVVDNVGLHATKDQVE